MPDRSLLTVMPVLMLYALTATTDVRAQTPDADPSHDVVAFCRMRGTLDHPETTFFGAHYKPGMLPKPVEQTEASNWRCMDGQVFVCMNSADGDWCSKKDPSRQPNVGIRQFCADNPGSDFVATYAEAFSASAWRCKGTMPIIIKTWRLDHQDYMRPMWLRLVVRNGMAIAPHPDDFGMR